MSHFGEMAETNISYFSVLVLPNKTSLYLHQIDVLFIKWVKTIFLMLSTSTAVVSVKIKLQWHQKKSLIPVDYNNICNPITKGFELFECIYSCSDCHSYLTL